MYPAVTATKKQMRMIQRIFFAAFLFLNNMSMPKPAFTNKPESNAPKARLPLTNNSLKRIEEAQFGIKPIIAANNGDKYLFVWRNAAKFSSPTKPIIKPNVRLIANTYPNISNEWNNG